MSDKQLSFDSLFGFKDNAVVVAPFNAIQSIL